MTARLTVATLFAALFNLAGAQDLEPRAYSAAPIGLNFLSVGVGRSSGDVLVDPSLPVTDVHATVNTAAIGAGRTFSFFGRTALAVGAFPYSRANASGNLGEEARTISRSGLANPRLRLSVNLVGGRAVTVSEFAKEKRPTIVGVSLTAVPPLGQYDPMKLVNLGSNRWLFKPEVGYSRLVKKWTLDAYAGVWFFTTNGEFYPGSSTRTQAPIVAIQAHSSYTLKPRLWVAFNATWYSGGTTTVDGVTREDHQDNTRVGATVSFPLTRQQSLKIGYTHGATTRIGADFTTISGAWQLSWFD